MQNQSLDGFRLSPQQRRLWSLLQTRPSDAYRAQCAVLLAGDLDEAALGGALLDVADRHEVLRTAFQLLPGMTTPLQVVAPPGCPLADGLELGGLGAEPSRAAIEELLAAMRRRPVDVAAPPLGRAGIGRLAASRHLLVLDLPALLADAVSLGNLTREIGLAYAARRGAAFAGAEPLQYVDLAEWQNELLDAEETEPGRAYWRRLEIGPAAAARLPGGRPAERGRFDPGAVPLAFAAGESARLAMLAGQLGVDLPVLLSTCWRILLARLTGEETVMVGVGCDGRAYDELKGALGLFARCLPVVTRIPAAASFAELAGEVGAAEREAAQWQDCFSWDLLVAPGEEPPVCSFGFEWREPAADDCLAALGWSPVAHFACHEPFEVKLSCVWQGGELRAELQYAAAAQERAEMVRLAARLRCLIASAVERPTARAGELDLLPADERRWLLYELNDTALELPPVASAAELVERGLRRRPDAPAVIWRHEELSYEVLARRAAALARHLRRLGVGPEVIVGVCLPRGPEMVIGILAVLQAGGAYLPLDPGYPRERLSFMLADSRASVLVTDPTLAGTLAREGVEVVDPATVGEDGQGPLPPAGVLSDNTAYVIYTSGSAGQPKGVAVSHRNLVHSTAARLAVYCEPVSAYLLLSSFAFDSSVAGIFWTLCDGGALVLPEDRAEPERLLELVARNRVSHVVGLPSLYALLLRGAAPGQLGGLRTVIVAGEPCSRELVESHHRSLPGVALFNEYGPTEATVWSTVAPCQPAPERVSIGRPIPNARIYLVDAAMVLVPAGLAGELLVGGEGIARGYLDRPELTAERFVPDPWGGAPGARLYRTGDLARHLPSGDLDFLGRVDHQVKIRGFRVELDEIEAVLGGHPAVAETVVSARSDPGGGTRLVAYLTAAGEAAPNLGELRAYLGERLPEPMVPAVFCQLATLPRLPNGKIDRGALPDPEEDRLRPMAGFAAPRTPTEEALAAMWAELFGRDRIGVEDDFFELGGHSLKATQLIAWVHKAFGVEMPVRRLFEAPTVAGLATRVDALLAAGEGVEAPAIEPAPRDGDLPLSFSQQRLWFIDQLQPGGAEFNIASAVHLAGDLDAAALDRALAEVERRHEALRSSFPAVGGEPRLRIAAPRPGVLSFVDLTDLPAERRQAQARRLAIADSRRPFDLARGPLLRGSLLRLGEREHVLLLAMHHVVADFWSLEILIRELTAIYRAFAHGEPSPLPELAVQFADFAVWQRRWLQGEVLERELAYWRRTLAGAVGDLRLPLDRPRPAIHTSRGDRCALAIGGETAAGLRALCRGEGTTLFMTVLAVFDVLMRHYAGRDRLVVGTNVANRGRYETAGLIGFFVNQLVLAADLSGDPTFRELLGRVREAALSAYAHQDLPFEKLVEELQPERDLSRPLLFQVKVEVQTPGEAPPDLPGLTLSQWVINRGVVRYDLHLSLGDFGGELAGWFQYNTDLFDAATAERLARKLERLAARVAADPEIRLSALEAELSELARLEELERLEARKKANLEGMGQTRRRVVVGEGQQAL